MSEKILWIARPSEMSITDIQHHSIGASMLGITHVIVTGPNGHCDTAEIVESIEVHSLDALVVPSPQDIGRYGYDKFVEKIAKKSKTFASNERRVGDIAMISCMGWPDIRAGAGNQSRIITGEMAHTGELCGEKHDAIIEKCRMLAGRFASDVHNKMLAASSDGAKTIVVATGILPFIELAVTQQGKSAPPDVLPWIVSQHLGEMITSAAQTMDQTRVVVLSGGPRSSIKHSFSNVEAMTAAEETNIIEL